MAKNLATEMAPPFVLVAHYFIAGAVFYTITSFLLPFYAGELNSFFLSPAIASLMHLYLLGFIMMIIFGAMYQLVPVVLEVPIFSKDFAYIQFYLFITGIILFSFALGVSGYIKLLPYGAMMMYISMLIFIANVFLTYKEIELWSITAKFILVSNIFLLIGVSIGFYMALDLIYGFGTDLVTMVTIHISATIVGYILMTIMGIGMILLPMFSLSHGFSEKSINAAFYSIIVGLLLFIGSVFIKIDMIKYIGIFFISVSIVLALYQMWLIFVGRIRKQNDYWAKNMMASFVSLILSLLILVAAILENSQNLYILFGFMLFFGFFVFFIVGHIYKILPFLVWYQRYSPLVGKIKVPMLNDMVKEKVADMQFWITLIGATICSVAIIFKIDMIFAIGAVIMAVATLLVIYNIYYTLIYGLDELKKYNETVKG